MSIKTLKNWAGMVSILWMMGVYQIFGYPPCSFFNALFGVENSAQLSSILDLLIWLGVGLLFAVFSLRRWRSAGQVFAIIAVCIFVYFAWCLFHPDHIPDVASFTDSSMDNLRAKTADLLEGPQTSAHRML